VLPQLPPRSRRGRLLLTYTLNVVGVAGLEPAASRFRAWLSGQTDLHSESVEDPAGAQPACARFADGDLGRSVTGPKVECRDGVAPSMEAGHSGVRLLSQRHELVRSTGFEPVCLAAPRSERSMSASFTTSGKLEMRTGSAPAIPTLERRGVRLSTPASNW
jgi:hypothetical protein